MNLKSLFAILTLFYAGIFSVSAQFFSSDKSGFHISVEPTISYSDGNFGEYLYYSSPSDKKISYLEWDKEIFLFGVNVETSYKNLHFDFGFASSVFDQSSGQMQDSDWLNTKDYSMKTTYSVGENEAVQNYEVNARIHYEFKTTSWLSFSPAVSFKYNFDSFERHSAEGWYGQGSYSSDGKNHNWYDDEAQHFPYTYWSDEKNRFVTRKLAGIDYYRHSFFTFFGVSSTIIPHPRFSFDVDFLLSPFSYFYAVDTHHSQSFNKHYRMIQFSYFNVLALGLRANFSLNKNFDFSLGTNYLFSFEIARGTLFSDTFSDVKQDNFYNTGQDSGATLENFTVLLGCKIKIL